MGFLARLECDPGLFLSDFLSSSLESQLGEVSVQSSNVTIKPGAHTEKLELRRHLLALGQLLLQLLYVRQLRI